MTTIPLYQVDAFTSQPFKGNPAAVCLLEAPLSAAMMQAIAAEMNLSETAFVRPLEGEWKTARRFGLRWFTPQVEVQLCGHATLATAAVLFRELGVTTETVMFETLSGELAAQRVAAGIRLDFPADAPQSIIVPPDVTAALGDVDIVWAGRGPKTTMLLLELQDESLVRELQPNFERLGAAMNAAGMDGPIVTATGAPPYDFVSRFFAPTLGINEDPVTGSAHTVLAPYWSMRLSKETFFAYQASARGGELLVQLLPGERVALVGEAVVILRGTLEM